MLFAALSAQFLRSVSKLSILLLVDLITQQCAVRMSVSCASVTVNKIQ